MRFYITNKVAMDSFADDEKKKKKNHNILSYRAKLNYTAGVGTMAAPDVADEIQLFSNLRRKKKKKKTI